MNTGGWEAWITGYLAGLAAGGRPSSSRLLRRAQLRYLSRTLGAGPAAVDAELLVGWLSARAPGWKHETLRSYVMALRGFYRWAYATGRVGADVAGGLPRVSMRRGLPRPVPERVWRDAAARADERVALMLRLAAEAGLRRAEIAGLRVADLSGGRGRAVLLVAGKGGRDRRVPISNGLGAAIREHADGREWLFPSQSGGHISAQWAGELCSIALGGRWTLHTLRHRFGTAAYRGSHDLRAVQELLGHSSPATTQIYIAVNEDALREAARAAQ
jgi:integrase